MATKPETIIRQVHRLTKVMAILIIIAGIVKLTIPDWIKNNAGWWEDGSIDSNSFVQSIQFLIAEKILEIP